MFHCYSCCSPLAHALVKNVNVQKMRMSYQIFLRRYCLNPDYICPSPTCGGVSMVDHRRKFVHGRACIEISTQQIASSSTSSTTGAASAASGDRAIEVPQVDADNRIRAWHWCTRRVQVQQQSYSSRMLRAYCLHRCHVTSVAEPLPIEVWHLSLAKYLEYLCNSEHIASHMLPKRGRESSG